MKKVAAATFGCKVNQYETSCVLDKFCQNGYQIVSFTEKADVYIINSCTVTNRADFKSRNAIRQALIQKELNPEAKIIVTGCYSQRIKKEIYELGHIDLITDNNEKSKLFELMTESVPQTPPDIFDELSTTQMIDHNRAFIKIQDGCDYRCAYCAVSAARGLSRSREPSNILNQISLLTEKGYSEFVLGGINLGLFGREKKDNYFLADLLYDIEKISGVELIRLSSIEPQLFDDNLIEFLKFSDKICPHFHIPLQAGSNEILQKMNRNYTCEEFRSKIEQINSAIPKAAFGYDVILGFPGETDSLFRETHDFINSLPAAYLHGFPFSRRPGTLAWSMKDQIHGIDIKKRCIAFQELSDKKSKDYIESILMKEITLRGVVESRKAEFWTGLSDHWVRFYLPDSGDLKKKCLHLEPLAKRFDGIECVIKY